MIYINLADYNKAKSILNKFAYLEPHAMAIPAIDITPVDGFSDNDTRLLNYVAISRATTKLFILYNKKAESERQQMILSGFKNIQH